MNTFKLGEIAILCNLPTYRDVEQYNGTEVEIVGGLEFRDWFFHGDEPKEGMCYLVKLPYKLRPWHCRPQYLRKKDPPKQRREDVGEWDLCPWQPECSTVGKEGGA